MEITRTEIESMLAAMRPAMLEDATLQRLEKALQNDTSLTIVQARTESSLADLQPVALSAEMESKFMNLIRDVPFRLNDKIVLFPRAAKEPQQPAQKTPWKWSAAAAVAIAGGLAALMIPHGAQTVAVVNKPQTKTISSFHPNSSQNIVATSYGSDLQDASDQGVVWGENNQPMRVLHVEYKDRVLVRDAHGVERMLFLPRQEVIVVPEKID